MSGLLVVKLVDPVAYTRKSDDAAAAPPKVENPVNLLQVVTESELSGVKSAKCFHVAV